MKRTKHFQQRMGQRGINSELVELVLEHGFQDGDATVLNRRAIKSTLESLDKLRARLTKALDKGGLRLIAVDGVLITGYQLE